MSYTERLSEQLGAIGGVQDAATVTFTVTTYTSPVYDSQAVPYFQRIGVLVQLTASDTSSTATPTATATISATAGATIGIQIQAAPATAFATGTLTTLASEAYTYADAVTAVVTPASTATITAAVQERCGADIEVSELGANRYVRAVITRIGTGGSAINIRSIVLAGSPRYAPTGDSN